MAPLITEPPPITIPTRKSIERWSPKSVEATKWLWIVNMVPATPAMAALTPKVRTR